MARRAASGPVPPLPPRAGGFVVRRVPADARRTARELGIEPGILASREALTQLLLSHIEGFNGDRTPPKDPV